VIEIESLSNWHKIFKVGSALEAICQQPRFLKSEVKKLY